VVPLWVRHGVNSALLEPQWMSCRWTALRSERNSKLSSACWTMCTVQWRHSSWRVRHVPPSTVTQRGLSSPLKIVMFGCPYVWTQPFDRLNSAGEVVDHGTLAGHVGAAADIELFTHSLGNIGLWPISNTSLTSHLCLRWMSLEDVPPPAPLECPCTPAYIANEQASFLSHIRDHYTTVLTLESDYPTDPLSNHITVLSEAGWAGCAAPFVCVDCKGLSTTLVDHQSSISSLVCLLHQDHLARGDSDSEAFKCLDGTCLTGRCS